jgi:hypothetical protein
MLPHAPEQATQGKEGNSVSRVARLLVQARKTGRDVAQLLESRPALHFTASLAYVTGGKKQ